MKALGTIEQELADLNSAWEAHPEATWAWCCHHAILAEPLTEPWQNRRDYILSDKPKDERAIRLRNFRPVIDDAKLKLLDDDYRAKRKLLDDDYWAKRKPLDDDYDAKRKLLHDAEWPDNTWNGSDIFVADADRQSVTG